MYAIGYIAYCLYMKHIDPDNPDVPTIEISEYFHYFTVLVCRSIVVACKYSLYGEEHLHIINSTKLSEDFRSK